MEYKNLQQQLKTLMSLGYNREEIVKIATIVPSLFKYNSEEIKTIFNSIPVSKGELLKLSDTIVREKKNNDIMNTSKRNCIK